MPRTRTFAGLAPFFVVLSALGLLASRDAGATGPWVQSDDGYYVTVRPGLLSTSKYYDASGAVVDGGGSFKYRDLSVRFDGEYGMSSHMTFLLGMPLQFRKLTVDANDPPSLSNNGFGDLLFGLKYGFLDPAGNAALALELTGNTPTGYNSKDFGIPSMGRGRFSALAAVHAGMTFDPAPVYVQGEVGYRYFTAREAIPPDTTKSSVVSNAVVYTIEAGVFVSPKILIVGEYLAEQALDTKNKPEYQSLSQVGGNVQYRLKPGLDLLAGLRTTVSGKTLGGGTGSIAFKGTTIRLGVSLKGNDLGRYRGQGAYGYPDGTFPNAKPRKAPEPVPVPEPVPAPAATDSTTTPVPPSAPDTPK
jgi:hypothetical protein